jgi:hypothetical protein
MPQYLKLLLSVLGVIPGLQPVVAAMERAFADGKITIREGVDIEEACADAVELFLPNDKHEAELAKDIGIAFGKYMDAKAVDEGAQSAANAAKLATASASPAKGGFHYDANGNIVTAEDHAGISNPAQGMPPAAAVQQPAHSGMPKDGSN